ncbi:MAG: hypothetical protein ACJAZ2_002334 [Glaciecola sp.]|jgi:hypothetical protein
MFKSLVSFLQSWAGLFSVLFALVIFNMALFVWSNNNNFSEVQKRNGASGFGLHDASNLAYFHFYTGYFPLASLNENLAYSKDSALAEIEEHGENLIMESSHWYRLGENARIFALLPSAYLNKSPEYSSLRPFSSIIFTLSLLVLFFGFWQIQYALQGFLLVLSINLTPFFLYEVYTNDNIFSLVACAFFLVLGTNMFSLFSSSYNKFILLVTSVCSAVVLGFFTEIRNEVSIVILSLLLLVAFAKRITNSTKAMYIGLVFLSFLGTKQLIRSYFENEFERTKLLVQEKGGHVYEGETLSGHLFWHPFFCGLADFDTKYGYKWNDRYAYKYAVPVLKEKYGISLKYSGGFYADEYYDEDKLYYKKIEEIPEYALVLKQKVLGDIFGDPLWFIKIIFKRILRTLTTTIPVPYLGWTLLPLLYYLIRKRNWTYIKLLVIALPTSLTSILIYSNSGSTYNSLFVFLIIVVFLMLLKDRRKDKSGALSD